MYRTIIAVCLLALLLLSACQCTTPLDGSPPICTDGRDPADVGSRIIPITPLPYPAP